MTRIFLRTENTKCWQGHGEIRLLTLLIQLENGAPPVENGLVLAEEDEHRIPHDPAIPFLGRYPRELNTGTQTLFHRCS